MKHLRYVALTLCALMVAGCQTLDGVAKDFESIQMPSWGSSKPTHSAENLVYSGGCPSVEAVGELKTLSEFTTAADQNDYNLISKIEIIETHSTCSYDERSVTIDLHMDFLGTLGPQGRTATTQTPFFSYPFFVAVTSHSGKILAKEVFAASLTYDPGEMNRGYTEKLRQIIPIESKDRGSRYKVLVGFQLTPDQLSYNRRIMAEEKLRRDTEALKPSQFEQQAQAAQEQAVKDSIYIGRPVPITP